MKRSIAALFMVFLLGTTMAAGSTSPGGGKTKYENVMDTGDEGSSVSIVITNHYEDMTLTVTVVDTTLVPVGNEQEQTMVVTIKENAEEVYPLMLRWLPANDVYSMPRLGGVTRNHIKYYSTATHSRNKLTGSHRLTHSK